MFRELFKYTFLADKLMIDVFEQVKQPLPEAERLFSHILNAQHIWIRRILEKETLYERFQMHTVSDFRPLQNTNEETLWDILKKTDLNHQVRYFNSQRDQEYCNTLADVLFHIVNHSTYHRGQVATQFRQNEITPPVTDYVFFKRQGII